MFGGADPQSMPVIPVILCGGSGMRLWPVSRHIYPKPFVDRDKKRTLFMDTLLRIEHLPRRKSALIVCNEEHRFYVQEALSECGMDGSIILEPEGRNTAPAIALAALAALEHHEDALLLIMPSDHVIGDGGVFLEDVTRAVPMGAEGRLALFGVKPDRAECGYGYIECGEEIGQSCKLVKRFVEKPSEDKAQEMLAQDNFFWNCGIFFARASVFMRELEQYAPDVHKACMASWKGKACDNAFIRPDKKEFLTCPSTSIDYAVMEHTDRAIMIPLNTSWNDLGSWNSFYEIGEKDEDENVASGDTLLHDVKRSYIHSEKRLVAAIGVQDLAIIESGDAVLVMPRERTQDVRRIVERLKSEGREEYRSHPKVYRPWGSYENLTRGERFQVKRLIVKPGGILSLQFHHHRAEHWVIVRGAAEITINNEKSFYTENQSVYIPAGSRHMLKNPGLIPLEMIEVQTGSYLGEDDIVRLEDVYGRI